MLSPRNNTSLSLLPLFLFTFKPLLCMYLMLWPTQIQICVSTLPFSTVLSLLRMILSVFHLRQCLLSTFSNGVAKDSPPASTLLLSACRGREALLKFGRYFSTYKQGKLHIGLSFLVLALETWVLCGFVWTPIHLICALEGFLERYRSDSHHFF